MHCFARSRDLEKLAARRADYEAMLIARPEHEKYPVRMHYINVNHIKICAIAVKCAYELLCEEGLGGVKRRRSIYIIYIYMVS